ncbi:bifunctional diguanylate cyclase/phosphodiesterase [Agrobacterium salinitolerans]|uniref:bifunctional diguanylate cyclase/phosphodiesterase n=1 Tax=Agrobacterium salinitolerans TaxID=1183413 RepID=UPI0015726D57|nr:EAL domain-containing protein [Agrobacterium salinitolerans]NTA40306.1 EAL domain-containing protein [Agrobacterium salinitolerans]
MVALVSCITEQHNLPLLLVAVLVCVAGNLAAVFMLSRARQCVRIHRNLWLTVAGAVLGGTIWATHFLAMLAYSIPVSYQLLETGASIVVAIAISCLATFTLVGMAGLGGAAMSGCLVGLAIAAMHTIGLSAISNSALLESRVDTVVTAWVAGGAFTVSSMLVAGGQITRSRLVVTAFLLVLAVCSHHLISMSGLRIVPLYPGSDNGLRFIDRVGIAAAVCVVSSLLIAAGIAALFFDRYLTDVKGLANATFEAVVLTRAGAIVHANEQFVSMVGKSLPELKALPLHDFLEQKEGKQGLITSPDGKVPVDVVEGVIEYRGRETSVFGLRDIRERLEATERLDHLASHDPLTGLLNRRAFNARSDDVIRMADAEASAAAFLTLDLDRFKAINDVHGHAEGDLVLQQVAEVLRSCFNLTAIIGRVGGDEFSVLLPTSGYFQAQEAASEFMSRFKAVFAAHPKAAALGASIGIAVYPDHGGSLGQLQHNADAALYRAKEQGRGRMCAFDRFLDQKLRERRRLEGELRRAVQANEFFLLYQPIVETRSGQPAGYEALLRWRHPIYGVLSPAVFIEAAEESGSIVEIGAWVLREACRHAASWDENLFLAVNVSPRQLLSPDLLGHVSSALNTSRLSPERLELEVTETSFLEDRAEVAQSLGKLKALGVKLAMDDFGSGYSSITNLRRHPFDTLKIDRSYVAALEKDPVAEVIIDCALALGRSLGLRVVVEGVETEEQRAVISSKKPELMQGFLFGRPDACTDHGVPADAHVIVQRSV